MSNPSDPTEYEGIVYSGLREWGFRICRSGYDDLAQQDGFATRLDAQAECRRLLATYDPAAKVLNYYRFSASVEITVEGDTLEEARKVAEEELGHISESLDALWWSRNGPSRYSVTFTQHRYEE